MKETEQTLLDKIKDDVVHQYGYSSWIRFHEESAETGYHLLTSEIMDEIANRYATAKAQASCEATLKKASENAKITTLEKDCVAWCGNELCTGKCGNPRVEHYVKPSSITDPSNITIV